VIVASAGVGIAAAKGSTSTIPVVFFGGDDQAMLDGISAGSNAAKSILVFTDGREPFPEDWRRGWNRNRNGVRNRSPGVR
jgi:hypothetical protein